MWFTCGMNISETSTWLQDTPLHSVYPPLSEPLSVDVAIVGAGIAGLLTAYRLAKAGKSVALLDAGSISSGETGYTTAFLTQVIDLSLEQLEQKFGKETAAEVWNQGQKAIQYFKQICQEEKIDCDLFEVPMTIFTQEEKDLPWLQQETGRAQELHFPVSFSKQPLPFSTLGQMKVEAQAKFHPRQFLTALANRFTALGGQIYEKTKVKTLVPGKPHQLTTKTGTINATQVVLCTHQPQFLAQSLEQSLTPYVTHVIELRIPPQILAEGLYLDTADPYHYFRVDQFPDHQRIILGGEDHLLSTPPAQPPTAQLMNYFQKILPGVPLTLAAEWGGQILESTDGLPLIGALNEEKTMCVASGFSGNGMTFGMISAEINTAVLLGKESPLLSVCDPLRFTLVCGPKPHKP